MMGYFRKLIADVEHSMGFEARMQAQHKLNRYVANVMGWRVEKIECNNREGWDLIDEGGLSQHLCCADKEAAWANVPAFGNAYPRFDVTAVMELIMRNMQLHRCKVGIRKVSGGWRATIDGEREYAAAHPSLALVGAWLVYYQSLPVEDVRKQRSGEVDDE